MLSTVQRGGPRGFRCAPELDPDIAPYVHGLEGLLDLMRYNRICSPAAIHQWMKVGIGRDLSTVV
jgi:hypothetical protein